MVDAPFPKDAREIYVDEKGDPIAFCPKNSLGLTDLERARFYLPNKARLDELAARAEQQTKDSGKRHGVICIDVDDRRWTWLVDMLMPGHDWDIYRARGEKPVARGIVPEALLSEVRKEMYSAADELATDRINICIFAAGGIMVVHHGDQSMKLKSD